jgi:hypothetical protein
MKARFATLAAMALAFTALPAVAADGEPWMCRYKGYTEDGQYYYIAVKPFDGEAGMSQQLNSSEFAKALFDELAPGKRFSGETACALRPRDVTEKWFEKLLAGDDFFSGRNNTTLAEWRDGRMVALPWPKAAK